MNDIARVAGASLATVDRVLNARPGVRGFTIEKVNKAIAELGYIRGTPRKTRLACTRTAAATQ
ncbi:LacI family DNA-binding transcriptional regulator [Ruegeria arenilitoris]|uniref:LacI family DNA-binding transcriptional regulator n=1 Tax=Ruegeria arenilitoris TaxID=1173585 RepID=UPI003463C586